MLALEIETQCDIIEESFKKRLVELPDIWYRYLQNPLNKSLCLTEV